MYRTTFLDKQYEYNPDVWFNSPTIYPSDEENYEENYEKERKEIKARNFVSRKYQDTRDIDIDELSERMVRKSEKRLDNGRKIIDNFFEKPTKPFALVQCRNRYEARILKEYAEREGLFSKILKDRYQTQKIATKVKERKVTQQERKPTLYVFISKKDCETKYPKNLEIV